MKKVTPIVLSGGVGSRLWPLSTKNVPKQFLNLPFGSKRNLFQQTINGIKKSKSFHDPLIICASGHKFLVKDSLGKLFQNSSIIVEKIPRNTAISILLGIFFSIKNADYSLVVPSDHFIKNRDYSKMIPKNLQSFKGHIIYGIVPNYAATDYGYIEVEDSKKKISTVKNFFEKPTKIKANLFIKKNFFWNSGIFLLNNKKLLLDFKKYHPKIYKICESITECLVSDLEFYETSEKLMRKLPNISFDKAILEKNDNLSMMKVNFVWKDLGTWNSLDTLSSPKNLSLVKDSYIHNSSKNTTVISDRKFTIVNDLSNVIVVSNKESLFISSKKESGKIKEILSNKKFNETLDYQTIFYKPWGHYEVILRATNYLLKKITVNPNHRLSLQKHKFRSEHWVVVKGVAIVTRGKQKKVLKKNQSTFIPVGMEHCLENKGKVPLEIVEIQMGDILSETDIVRLDDPYKR